MKMHPLPAIIQGGMGAGVSDWRLARAVSTQGQLGVVSGTALDVIRRAAEPVSAYVGKGGVIGDTIGHKCICNALLANIGLGQARGADVEPGVVTCGDDLAGLTRFMPDGSTGYRAADVIARLLGA